MTDITWRSFIVAINMEAVDTTCVWTLLASRSFGSKQTTHTQPVFYNFPCGSFNQSTLRLIPLYYSTLYQQNLCQHPFSELASLSLQKHHAFLLRINYARISNLQPVETERSAPTECIITLNMPRIVSNPRLSVLWAAKWTEWTPISAQLAS